MLANFRASVQAKAFLYTLTFLLFTCCFIQYPLYALENTQLEGAYSANWSPDGSLLAISSRQGLWLYQPYTNDLEFLNHDFNFQSWTIDNQIFTGSGFYNPITRHMGREFKLQQPPNTFSTPIGLSRDAQSFALLEGNYLDTIAIYSTDNGAPIRRIKTNNLNAGPQIAWSLNNSQFAMLAPNRPSVFIIPNTDEPTIIEYSITNSPAYKPDQFPTRIRWNANGKLLAIALAPAGILLLNVENGEFTGYIEDQLADSFAWSPDGTLLAVSNGLDTVSVFDVRTGTVVEKYPSIHSQYQYRWFMEFSPFGGQLAVTNDLLGNEASTSSIDYFRAIGNSNAVQLFVPAPSIDRLKTVMSLCDLQSDLETSLTAQINANNLKAFTEQVSNLTEAQIPLGCKADVLAVAQALMTSGKS